MKTNDFDNTEYKQNMNNIFGRNDKNLIKYVNK